MPTSTRVNSFHHSFLPSGIRMWNSLPNEVVAIKNVTGPAKIGHVGS